MSIVRRKWTDATFAAVELRPNWTVRSTKWTLFTVEYDSLRRRWRIDPGGYERRELADALAQASGDRRDADWITLFVEKISGDLP